MLRRVAAGLAAILTIGTLQPTACARAQAVAAFPEALIEQPPAPSNAWAYATLVGGAGLIGASFDLAERGNDTYDAYLGATDPSRIQDLYDDARRYDRLASASLIAGESLIAFGLYLRFLRRPPPVRVSWGPTRCLVAWRF